MSANKKKNGTIEEQRRAREELLKLKRMQCGEIEPEPKYSEVAITPKTTKEKISHFFYVYKWHITASVVALLSIIFFVAECSLKTVYDAQIVYFTFTAVADSQTEDIADYFEGFAGDVNGDGEVNVQVINLSINYETDNVQYRNTMLTKLQAILSTENKAILYITDKDSLEYINNIIENNDLFINEPCLLSQDFYQQTTNETFGALPEGLGISCRRISDTMLQKQKDTEIYYNEALKILEAVK